ncbi:ligand-binding protein SH3 [Burkholderia multivorans]|uniref:Ligand-binding protein SH3 n=1 Tax=Burkholderia multivorans TaxID=87883 RepID=A0A8E2RS61_9BURK|nr:ligand-binding protein SH3 [Burkholderia multivorans]MBN6728077.1 ligand-binding protein SH3 [Burkholderia multivorans]MBU9492020.1 ligand-binding protein SH3 [Burkholderia multivorans]MBY4673072.1 ligand-binding protein SH3 [Burkholderia multivorans]MCA8260302.1 ligand-binding protein SH3 [Burkholderia multivorans]MDN7883108.1 ligand-binding protein SH3 [Burkholderia multivorans]
MIYGYLTLMLSSIASAAASVLLKSAADLSPDSARLLQLLGGTGMKLAAVGCYGIGFIFYSLSLKSIQLQVAYPIMVGLTILLLFAYGFVFSQPISTASVVGAGLVCAGIFLISIK